MFKKLRKVTKNERGEIKKTARYEAAFDLMMYKLKQNEGRYSSLYDEDVRAILIVAGLSVPELKESEDKDV